MAESDDTESFSGEFASHERLFFPFSGACGDVGGNELAVCGEDHRDYFFGNGIGVGAGSVHNINIFTACILDVDVVVTGTGTDDELESGQGIHDFRCDFLTADDDGFRVGVRFCQIQERRFHILNDCESFRGQDFRNDLVKFCRNENFFH